MALKDFKSSYKEIVKEDFPSRMEISFYNPDRDDSTPQKLIYEKATWTIEGVEKGLRYGENPGQKAALYKLINGNLTLGEVNSIEPGRYLASDVELLQSGKHPGKTNITDADNALNILRYFSDTPCAVIVKHNNPCGVAKDASLAEAYNRANMADRVAAFGGAIALNRPVDKETANLISLNYAEVVIAPEFEEGAFDILKSRKNLRIMRIENIQKLQTYIGQPFLDYKSLIDGGIIIQWSYIPKALSKEDLYPAQATFKGKEYKINRMPTEAEYDDLIFGWLVESGITSNSVIYVKDGVTVGIGTGEQDRVGVAEIARDKAYRKLADRICWESYQESYNNLKDEKARQDIWEEVIDKKGGLVQSCMVSDAFFPFRDGVDVGIKEGVTAVVQPGGSLRDFESIQACNESNVAMVFTGQRSFKH
jgi:phosphoribosylaminoimidazolecarboxamide formyltransferase/IMP cyclohydrolase